LYSDASLTGIGAALKQEQDGVEVLIGFFGSFAGVRRVA
jgi:hypothetical protein